MQNEKNNRGIMKMLVTLNIRVDVWLGGFKFTLTEPSGKTRVFSFQVEEQTWVELTPAGAVIVSTDTVSQAIQRLMNPEQL